jgi:hypothetical protein
MFTASGNNSKNAPPRRVPEAKPTKAITTRLSRLSFKPTEDYTHERY